MVCGILWFIDTYLDRIVSEWFKNLFIITYYMDGYQQEQFNWTAARRFFVPLFLFLILMGYCACRIYIEYKLKKDQKAKKTKLETDILHLLQDPEQGILSPEYANIENELLKLRLDAVRQKELYEKEAERKNDLITYLAHDLKTPLASVIGYLNFLSEAQELPIEHRQKYTDIALDKAYRLEELINQFFEITRFNIQTIILQKERVNIHILLEQVADEFYPLVQKKDCTIHLCVQDEQELYVDPDKFGRVLNNVLKNAVSYCYEQSEIKITETTMEKEMLIEIENQGNPIPKEKLAMIFDKFYRVDEARSTQKGGAGLGLAIAKEIMIAHDGDIQVTSDYEKTVFTIRLPLGKPS